MNLRPSCEHAIFAAGCFWGVQATFDQVSGVITTVVGYCGGATLNPTYQEVCQGSTGHAEAILITFDPTIISYAELLDIFFTNHDPTTLNSQGPDHGSQYRSAIFFLNEKQRSSARDKIEQLTDCNIYSKPIVTEIIASTPFHDAEEYHQKYYLKHNITCTIRLTDKK